MKRYSMKTPQGKLDKLLEDFFHSRPCDYASTNPEHQCKGNLEWCHIKSRRYLSTRWLWINAFTLCSSAHRWFTNHPDLFTRWIDKNYPGRIDELNKVFQKNSKIYDHDLEELYEKLQGELK